MNKFICRVSYCNYPEGQCLEGCDQICPLMRMLEPPTEQEPPAEQPAGPDAEPAIPPGYKLVPVEPSAFGVLFAVEQAIQNGDCPWQIEQAFHEYEAERKNGITKE